MIKTCCSCKKKKDETLFWHSLYVKDWSNALCKVCQSKRYNCGIDFANMKMSHAWRKKKLLNK